MKNKSLILVLGSLITAILIAIILQNFLNKNEKGFSKNEESETTLVLVTPIELTPGTIVSLEKLVWKEWPTKALNPHYITKNKTAAISSLNGATVRFSILANEPVRLSNLISLKGKSILSAIIRSGMRGVTVPFNKLSNAPSFLAPGDLIDVVIPKRAKESGDGYYGQTLIKAVRILAVDRTLQNPNDKNSDQPKTITLEVTPDQAEDLAASIRDGEIVISLRSAFSKETDVNDSPVKIQEAADKMKNVMIFRGKEKSEVTFKEK